MLDHQKEAYWKRLDDIEASDISDHGKGERIIGLLAEIARSDSWDFQEFMKACPDHSLVARLASAEQDATTSYFREWLPMGLRLAQLVYDLGYASGEERQRIAAEIMKVAFSKSGWCGWFSELLSTLITHHVRGLLPTGCRTGYTDGVMRFSAGLIALQAYDPK